MGRVAPVISKEGEGYMTAEVGGKGGEERHLRKEDTEPTNKEKRQGHRNRNYRIDDFIMKKLKEGPGKKSFCSTRRYPRIIS